MAEILFSSGNSGFQENKRKVQKDKKHLEKINAHVHAVVDADSRLNIAENAEYYCLLFTNYLIKIGQKHLATERCVHIGSHRL